MTSDQVADCVIAGINGTLRKLPDADAQALALHHFALFSVQAIRRTCGHDATIRLLSELVDIGQTEDAPQAAH